ncbi:MAG: dTMP kinase [SAR202 cluster bacterium]|nr:dTMP kinase [SAR202 cluster bacterium]
MAGFFISIEGGEGAGKTTQGNLLRERLAAAGYRVEFVHEPGGTDLGEDIRRWVKSSVKPLTPEAELFLFAAARAELVRRVIKPALDKGGIVLADRYADSTTAYQGYGRRLPMRAVESANNLATGGLWPDLTLLLDADPEAVLARARVQPSLGHGAGHRESTARNRGGEHDQQRFEQAGLAFHRRVREGFHAIARQQSERWAIVDAGESVEAVADELWRRVMERLQARATPLDASARLPGI